MSRTPPLAIVIQHTVSDYDTWKAAFDAHQGARKAAGILGHHINVDGDKVAVYLPALDRAAVEGFLSSPGLKNAMQDAGVTSAPTIAWLAPVEDGHIGDRPTAAMMVTHRVEDFDMWKRVYDSVADLRASNGVIGAAVNRGLDDPNLVTVYHQAETRAELEAFAASPELKSAMKAGGVAGRPEISFFDAPAGAAY